jgi:hypothetical protein
MKKPLYTGGVCEIPKPWGLVMKGIKGTVRNNVIVLEGGIHLPDGTEVEVRLKPSGERRHEPFLRLLRHSITRPIGMEEVIGEDKREREERWEGREGD